MPVFKWKGKKIFYQQTGKGEPIIFLHCWLGNHSFYRHQISMLRKDFTCISFDLPGHGVSEKTGEYGPVPFSGIVSAFIRQQPFKGRRFILVGHSLGGMTAMQTALDNPDRIKALILIDTSSNLRGHLGQDIATPLTLLVAPLLTKGLKSTGIDLTAVHPLCGIKIRRFIKAETGKVSDEVFREVLKGIISFNVQKRLKEIQVPTLIIVGTSDIYTDIRHALTMRVRIRHSRLALIPGAGHMGILEQPLVTNKKIRDFLVSNGLQ
ncbi:MAG: alpha/beta hydrolase [Deltaproteobacteria bacterium]|nr:alpha/beta hydrolase [Deltaproteobacteria bacterium]MCL5276502.1 alpha/beta hydrolase [Deltaproteobacteria bacterium]